MAQSSDFAQMDGVKDLPAKARMAFCASLKYEAEGDNVKAMNYLNLAVRAEQEAKLGEKK